MTKKTFQPTSANTESTITSIQKHKNPPRKTKLLISLILIALIGGSGVYWYTQQAGTENSDASGKTARSANGGRRNAPLAPVRIATVGQQNMPHIVTALGTITPKEHVLLTSRVNGELLKEHFTEGQYVEKGEILFTIDPESYEIAVTQAKGQLLKDQANLANAQADVLRFQNLTSQRAISEQELATQKALVKQLEGTVKSSQAALDNALLQLSYTEIKAPISGKLGLKQISIGNYIQANNTPLISITQTAPIDVRFSIPESQINPLTNAIKDSNSNKLSVEVWDRTNQHKLAEGKFLSFDNLIDTTTGTIAIKAEFENSDNRLFPNQFVNTRLNLQVIENAMVIPINALQLGADGEFVWRVIPKKSRPQPSDTVVVPDNAKKDNKVTENKEKNKPEKSGAAEPGNVAQWEVEKINVTTSIRDERFIVIESGLSIGDKVVTDGVDRLSNGTAVDIVQTPDNQSDNSGSETQEKGQNTQSETSETKNKDSKMNRTNKSKGA